MLKAYAPHDTGGHDICTQAYLPDYVTACAGACGTLEHTQTRMSRSRRAPQSGRQAAAPQQELPVQPVRNLGIAGTEYRIFEVKDQTGPLTTGDDWQG